MKFLCVECDEAMHLEDTRGPDGGSMTVLFACPTCGRRTAMLTNTMETQVVRSLGVKIGGRTTATSPMEMIRGALKTPHPTAAEAAEPDSSTNAASAVDSDAHEAVGANNEEAYHSPNSPTSAAPNTPMSAASKCPFTGIVNDAFAEQQKVRWTESARLRMDRIPEFARPMVMKGIEDAALAEGFDVITEAVLDDVRTRMGI